MWDQRSCCQKGGSLVWTSDEHDIFELYLACFFNFWLLTPLLGSIMWLLLDLRMSDRLTAYGACRKPGSWLKLNLFHTRESDAYTFGDGQNGHQNGHAKAPVNAAVRDDIQHSSFNRWGIWTSVCKCMWWDSVCSLAAIIYIVSAVIVFKPLRTSDWST